MLSAKGSCPVLTFLLPVLVSLHVEEPKYGLQTLLLKYVYYYCFRIGDYGDLATPATADYCRRLWFPLHLVNYTCLLSMLCGLGMAQWAGLSLARSPSLS